MSPRSIRRGRRKKGAKPIYQTVRERLMEFIETHPAGTRLPTYIEMKQLYGAKQSAVDRVMQELAFQGLIERRPRSGIYISEQAKQKYVGVLFGSGILEPDASPFWKLLHMYFQSEFYSRGYACKTYIEEVDFRTGYSSSNFLNAFTSDVRSGRLIGLMVGLYGIYTPYVEMLLKERPLPTVALAPVAGVHSFLFDFESTIRIGCEYLSRLGYRKIMVISPLLLEEALNTPNSTEVREGLKKCFEQYNLPMNDRLWSLSQCVDVKNARTYMQIGASATSGILRNLTPEEKPDAALILDDMCAQGALLELERNGFKIGEDIKIVTTANEGSPALRAYHNRITRIVVDPFALSQRMVEGLCDLMEHKVVPKTQFFEGKIVENSL